MPGISNLEILSAGINFGKPENEFIVEATKEGEAISCRNVRTGIEYIGGGGGDSDFSVAEVTLVGEQSPLTVNYFLAMVDEENNSITLVAPMNFETATIKVPLYKGKLNTYIEDENATQIVISGNAEVVDGILSITGDCTLYSAPVL